LDDDAATEWTAESGGLPMMRDTNEFDRIIDRDSFGIKLGNIRTRATALLERVVTDPMVPRSVRMKLEHIADHPRLGDEFYLAQFE
jgi:hypothetical protein